MTVRLKPEMEEYIAEQVKAGRFSCAQEVVEAGIARLMLEPEPNALDEETIASIEEGEAQCDRGECRPWEDVREELRAKYFPDRSI